MIVSNPSLFVCDSPDIDPTETRWASDQLAALIEQLGPDSPVRMILSQARRELESLAASATAQVAGPVRVAA